MSKYKRGNEIVSISHFSECEDEVFVVNFGKCDKVLSRGFLISWQYRTLKDAIDDRRVYKAERIGE